MCLEVKLKMRNSLVWMTKVASQSCLLDAISSVNRKPPDTDLSYLKMCSPVNLSLILPCS
jgi:hypothetical protein